MTSSSLPEELWLLIFQEVAAISQSTVLLSVCLVSHQFLRCALAVGYSTVILRDGNQVRAFVRMMTGSPVLFRPSLVARVAYIGFGFGFLNQGGSDEFAEIVRTCTNISALHLDCYPDVTAAELQGYFADGLRLRHLVLGSGDGLILRISQSDWRAWFANLTHLELDNSRFCQPITLRDIPSLTHLLVQSMMGDYSEMKMSHLTPHIDSLPRSVRFFALVLVSGANSKIPFVNDALAESILALHHPAVVLGTRDRVTPIQSDSPHRKHFILDFANQYTWKHGRFVRWEYGDSLWTMIEDMVENRKALPLLTTS